MKPVVVGIAGGTASGKTTAARALSERLGRRCLWLTHDRYYRSLPDAFRDDPTGYNFDHPDALDTERFVDDVRALVAGHAVRVPVYDFSRHARADEADWEWVEPREIVLVEGILVLGHEALRGTMDHRVYVHTPDDLRLIRRIRRDLADRGRHLEEVLRQYEATVRPMHEQFVAPTRAHAQLVVDGTTTTSAMVGAILERVSPR